MAKSGYFGGNPVIIWNSPVNIVLETYDYEMFMLDYENTYYEINKEGK